MRRNCPLENGYVRQAPNAQGAETVGQVAWTIPIIYVAVEDRQAYHRSIVVEVEGKIAEQFVFVLIDRGSTHNYITPRIVEICAFKK